MPIVQPLPLVRGLVGLLMILLGTATIITFGANLDNLNFPGANIKLKLDDESDKIPAGRGWTIDTEVTCSNSVKKSDVQSALVKPLCVAENKDNEDWNYGWVVAPKCARVTNKPLECVEIGTGNYVANLGGATAIAAALHCLLAGIHTFIAIRQQDLGYHKLPTEEKENQTNKQKRQRQKQKYLLIFNAIWAFLGIALCVVSGVAWNGLCDKIDAGLGRTEADTWACSTEQCEWSFGLISAIIGVTIMWFHLPHIAIWFSWVESA